MSELEREPAIELVEAVARAIAVAECDPEQPGHQFCRGECAFARPGSLAGMTAWNDEAEAAIAAVRAYDAQQAAWSQRATSLAREISVHIDPPRDPVTRVAVVRRPCPRCGA